MISVTRIVVLLGACVATLLCCDVTQAKEAKFLSQPAVAPARHFIKITTPAPSSGKQIVMHFQLAEISLSKMQRLGVDLSVFDGQKNQKQLVRDLISGAALPAGWMDALQKKKLARVLAASKIVTYENHLTTLQIGTDIPFSAKQNGRQSVTDFVSVGTQLEVVSKIFDDQKVLLKIKLDWSALEEASTDRAGAPRVRHIKINTAILAKLGEATLLSGSSQTVRQGGQDEELIMILTVTPELADRMDQAVSRAPTGKRLR